MARLTIVIETPPRLEPSLADPEDIAQELVDVFNEWAQAQGMDPVGVVRAEWGHHLDIPRP